MLLQLPGDHTGNMPNLIQQAAYRPDTDNRIAQEQFIRRHAILEREFVYVRLSSTLGS